MIAFQVDRYSVVELVERNLKKEDMNNSVIGDSCNVMILFCVFLAFVLFQA